MSLCLLALPAPAAKKKKPPAVSPVDAYIQAAAARVTNDPAFSATPGSTWRSGALLSDLARDLRASQVDDMVTIVVSERASAVSKGTVKTSRASNAKYSVSSIFGKVNATGALANLAGASGAQSLAGDGATTRDNALTTTITARVTHVLPNGYLALEGTKNVVVNSENQLVTVRGVARTADITPDNLVRSDHLAQLDVRINGKGVVGDAIKRPFFLYRLLLGLLPF